MSLTRAGEMLLAQAEALLASGSELQGAARHMQGELTGSIDIGMPGEPPEFLRLGELARGVHRDLPLVELRTRSHSVGQLFGHLRAGALTAAFSIGINPPRDLQWQALRSVCYRVPATRWSWPCPRWCKRSGPDQQPGGFTISTEPGSALP
jgi:DNA-binding transcriptional LysR family regulator